MHKSQENMWYNNDPIWWLGDKINIKIDRFPSINSTVKITKINQINDQKHGSILWH